MSNHVHFMLAPLRRGAISRLMQHLQSYHARYMNGLKGTEGHLWRNHFHAKHIATPVQYRQTLLYIEQNPAAAGVAKHASSYSYSSAPAHRANNPSYTLQSKLRCVTVRLYLDRWRAEFAIDADTNWVRWLESPRQAAFLQDVARLIGKPPQPAIRLPDLSAIPARAG
jgi:hypothetical protein